MHSSLHALPVLQDNVIWIWVKGAEAVVIDPAVAEPVRDWLEQHQLSLTAVLQTHHHGDHIGGTPDLLQRWPQAAVIASADDRERIPFQTMPVREGERITVLGEQVEVLDVAAHTRAHIAFFIPNPHDSELGPLLFCGDTLFSGGCGRLFEGSSEQMHQALQKLAELPEATKVCCAHEYTEANLQWAVELRPKDMVLAERLREVRTLRANGDLSLPSSIGLERSTNLFMQASSATELGVLRAHKDQWRPARAMPRNGITNGDDRDDCGSEPPMSAKAITTQDAPAPVGPYNQAVLAGEWLYCSGQIPLDPTTGAMVGNGDVAAETHQVLKNLCAVLKEAGATPAQVVRTTVFLADLGDFQTVNGIYAEVFGEGVSPARACVEVAALPKGARVEIDCVAWLGS